MDVFVTGASGFVGAAVTQELLAHGHRVTGLARSAAAAAAISGLGAAVLHGDVTDLDSLARGARTHEAVIHCAFNHDFSRFAESCAEEGRALLALGAALAGTQKPLIATSGQMAAHESEQIAADHPHPRAVTELSLARLRAQGLRAMALRLPPSTHGAGDHGFVPILIGIARQSGFSAYVAQGDNRWPAVHRRDAARVYRRVLERGHAPCYHACAEEGLPFRAIAEAIGQGLGLPCRSLSPAEAEQHFSWFARFAMMDMPASSAWTQASLSYHPQEPGLLQDMAAHYFA